MESKALLIIELKVIRITIQPAVNSACLTGPIIKSKMCSGDQGIEYVTTRPPNHLIENQSSNGGYREPT